MNYSKVEPNKYLIRLQKGEKINSSLKLFCQEKEIKNATFAGIGSVKNPILAHYRVDTRKYKEKELKGIFEVTSLLGNVGLFENSIWVHSHTTLGDEKMNAFAGHLVEAETSGTMEIVLSFYNTTHTKSHNDGVGLKLWDFPDEI